GQPHPGRRPRPRARPPAVVRRPSRLPPFLYLFRGSPPGPGLRRARQRFHPDPPLRAMPCPGPAPTVQIRNAPTGRYLEKAGQHVDTTRARVSETQPPAHYEITVEGILAPHWSAWFDGLQLASDGGRTILTGPVPAGAASPPLRAKPRPPAPPPRGAPPPNPP